MRALPIRVSLSFWYALVLLALSLLLGVFVYAYLGATLRNDAAAVLTSNLHQILASVEVDNGSIRLPETEALSTPGTYFGLFDASGKLIAGTGGLPAPATAAERDGSPYAAQFRGAAWLFAELPIANDGKEIGLLRAGRDQELRTEALRRLGTGLAIGIPVALIFSVMGGLFLTRRAMGQVDQVIRTAASIGSGDLSGRIPPAPSNDEIGRLTDTFNDMVDRLEDAFKRERQFSSDAAHELRTPLSIMRGAAEQIRNDRGLPPALCEPSESIVLQAERMSRMVTQLLLLARRELGKDNLEVEQVDLRIVAEEVLNAHAQAARDAQVELTVDMPSNMQMRGDQTLITRLLYNLIDNAVTYTPPKGKVTVTASREAKDIILCVSDTGVGISGEQLPHVFERFYRASSAGTSRGFGLGLAVAKAIVEAHRGRIGMMSRPGLGTAVEVRLPTE